MREVEIFPSLHNKYKYKMCIIFKFIHFEKKKKNKNRSLKNTIQNLIIKNKYIKRTEWEGFVLHFRMDRKNGISSAFWSFAIYMKLLTNVYTLILGHCTIHKFYFCFSVGSLRRAS